MTTGLGKIYSFGLPWLSFVNVYVSFPFSFKGGMIIAVLFTLYFVNILYTQ